MPNAIWHASCFIWFRIRNLNKEDAMSKKAIAYVSDIVLGRTGEIIGRAEQKRAIEDHARENGIEILAWFEDEVWAEDVVTRPGIQKLLGFDQPYELILVERVWALSRNTGVLQGFFAELSSRKVKLEAATTLWDCVSQMTRHFFAKGRGLKPVASPAVVSETVAERPHIARPRQLQFLPLLRKV